VHTKVPTAAATVGIGKILVLLQRIKGLQTLIIVTVKLGDSE